MKYTLIILTIIASSCSISHKAQRITKQREKICQLCDTLCIKQTHDSVVIKKDSVTVIKYDTIYKLINPDTLSIQALVKCDTTTGEVIMQPIHGASNNMGANASIINNVLTISCYQLLDSIQILNEKINTISNQYVTVEKKIYIPKYIKEKSKFSQFTKWFFIFAMAIIIWEVATNYISKAK